MATDFLVHCFISKNTSFNVKLIQILMERHTDTEEEEEEEEEESQRNIKKGNIQKIWPMASCETNKVYRPRTMKRRRTRTRK